MEGLTGIIAQAQPLAAEPTLPGGYGAALLQATLALVAVCVLAWVVLRSASKAGLGRPGKRLRVLERVPLDGRRHMAIVEVDDRQLLLGYGADGAPTLLTELATKPTATTETDAPPTRSFSDALGALRRGRD